jgi:hypothetical protein
MSAANSRESAVEDMRPDYCLIMLAFSGRRAMANPKTSFQISPVRSAADLEATVRLFNTMHLLLGSWLSRLRRGTSDVARRRSADWVQRNPAGYLANNGCGGFPLQKRRARTDRALL